MKAADLLAGYPDHYRAELRLVILKALRDDPGENMSDSRLHLLVREFGFNLTREKLQTELLWLQDDASAVSLRAVGTAIIATLLQRGAEHLDRSAPIVGIQSPSRPR